jgi:putative transposase
VGRKTGCKTRVEEIFEEIALSHKIQITADLVHVFLSFPPRLSIAKVVGMFKSVSPSIIMEQYPEVRKELRL